MNEERIGRNYAEALLTLARKDGEQEEGGALIDAISVGMREDHTLRTFLESPKLSSARKIQILEKALGRRAPKLFLRFLETVIMKRRQMLIPEIASEYRMLIDESEDRVHVNVTVARGGKERGHGGRGPARRPARADGPPRAPAPEDPHGAARAARPAGRAAYRLTQGDRGESRP